MFLPGKDPRYPHPPRRARGGGGGVCRSGRPPDPQSAPQAPAVDVCPVRELLRGLRVARPGPSFSPFSSKPSSPAASVKVVGPAGVPVLALPLLSRATWGASRCLCSPPVKWPWHWHPPSAPSMRPGSGATRRPRPGPARGLCPLALPAPRMCPCPRPPSTLALTTEQMARGPPRTVPVSRPRGRRLGCVGSRGGR